LAVRVGATSVLSITSKSSFTAADYSSYSVVSRPTLRSVNASANFSLIAVANASSATSLVTLAKASPAVSPA